MNAETQAQSFRMLSFALMGAPFFVVASTYFVISAAPVASSPLVGAGLAAFLALGAHLLITILKPTLATLNPAELHGFADVWPRVQSHLMLRFSVCELPLILGLALTFVMSWGPLPLIVAALGTEFLLYRWVFPTRQNLSALQDRLNSAGAHADLMGAFYPGETPQAY